MAKKTVSNIAAKKIINYTSPGPVATQFFASTAFARGIMATVS